MLQSMTGFATKTIGLDLDDQTRIQLTINLKTLNSRFFETSCKLPYALNTLETKLIKLLKKKLHRGSGYLTMHLSTPNAFREQAQPSLTMVESYLKAMQTMQKKFSLAGQITISDILHLPNIFETEDKSVSKKVQKQIFDAVEAVINELIDARCQEGKSLQEDLQKRLSILKKEITSIEKLATKALEKRTQKISATLQKLATNKNEETILEVKKAALYTELDKMDIHEEIVRFKSHLDNLATIFAAAEIEKGKRIDFTLQELMREANTIAAKAPEATISSHAINLKVELEKAREQVQNIV